MITPNLKFKKLKYFNLQNLIYLILLTLPLYLIRFSVFGIPTTVLEIEIYLVVIIFLFYGLRKKLLKKYLLDFIRNPFFIPIAVFFVAGLISIFVSSERVVALGIFKAYFFDSIIFFFLFCSIVKTESEIKRSFKALVFSALILSVIGVFQYCFFPQFLQEGRIRSIFASPNYLSLYIAPIYFLSSIFVKKPINKNIFPFITSFFILFAIILTYSRGAWLGLLLGFIFLSSYIVSLKIKFKANYLFLILFLMGLAASFFFIIKGSYSLGLVSQNRVTESDNIRKEIWSTSIDIGLQHSLLGVGLGNFQNYFGEYTKNRINYPEYITPNAVTPHNILINIWLQVGLLGLVGLVGLVGIFFIKCFNGLKKYPLINLALISSMIAILGQGLVDSAIWKNDLIIVFLFLIGSSYIINVKGEKNGE